MPRDASIQPLLREAHRILLIRLRSLGDAVLMTPVPTALKAWRPSLHVAVLIEEPLGGIFRRHPAVDEVISVSPHETPVGRLRWIGEIRRFRYDVVFNMHSGPTAGVLTLLSGAPLRVAYARARFSSACNVRVPPSEAFWAAPRVHTVMHQLSPLRHLGIPVSREPGLELNLDPLARRRVGKQMEVLRLQPGRFVVIQPFQGMVTKEWDPTRFAALGQTLTRTYGVPVLAIAAGSDRLKLDRLLALASRSIVALPDVPLEEMMVWIDHCGLFIGNDSGPAHVAAALKKKIVVIFGSADPQVWHPWRAQHELLSAGLACIPCRGDRCYEFETPRCIESITVDQVLQAVARLAPF